MKEYQKPKINRIDLIDISLPNRKKIISSYCSYLLNFPLIRNYRVPPEELKEQRRSWAFGNYAIENPRITMETIKEAEKRLGEGVEIEWRH